MENSEKNGDKTLSHSDELRFTRRRLLKIGVYVPPVVLGMMIAAPYRAMAGANPPKAGGGNPPSCAPCTCAPCGQAGKDNAKACQKKQDKCNNAKAGNNNG